MGPGMHLQDFHEVLSSGTSHHSVLASSLLIHLMTNSLRFCSASGRNQLLTLALVVRGHHSVAIQTLQPLRLNWFSCMWTCATPYNHVIDEAIWHACCARRPSLTCRLFPEPSRARLDPGERCLTGSAQVSNWIHLIEKNDTGSAQHIKNF